MSEVAHVPYRRARGHELGAMPADLELALRARASLTPIQFGAWFALRLHLWTAGDLPTSIKRLAAIAGVTPRTFDKMVPALAELFDEVDGGRWGDVDLEAERDKRLEGSPAPPALPSDYEPSKSALSDEVREVRRQNALRTNEKRWGSGRRVQIIDGGRRPPDDGPTDGLAASHVSPDVANLIANGVAKPCDDAVDLPEGFAVGLRPVATGSPSHHPESDSDSESDSGSDKRESEERIAPRERWVSQADRSADVATAPAVVADHPGGMTAPVAPVIAETVAPPIANVSAAAVASAGVATPLPYTVAEALVGNQVASSPPPASPTPPPSDAAIIAALRKAGGAKIPATLLTPPAIVPLKELMAEGCDFTRDILTVIETSVPALNEPLRSWRAAFIRKGAVDNRDERQRRAAAGTSTEWAKVYLDDPANAAALEALYKKRPYLRSSRRAADHDAGGRYQLFLTTAWREAVSAARLAVQS